jgi:hypothetical protein
LLSAAGSEALEFFGAYLIARAFFFGPTAVDRFVRVLRTLAIIAVLLAMADSISGRYIFQDAIAAIFQASAPPQVGFRGSMVRATSSFDHAILFGTFCAISAAILIYCEQSLLRRYLAVGLCFVGCVLSLSSAALMSFAIVLTTYTYDRLMKRFLSRWRVFGIVLGTMVLILFLTASHPLGWAISHLTLDPETGYFRMMIWDAALVYIARAPFTGHAYGLFNTNILDGSVDCVWLVLSLRFGIPMAILFFLTNVAAFFPTKQKRTNGINDSHMDRTRRAFTLALLMFMFAGLTVHFWNFMWIFWGLCIGIRASLRELSLTEASVPFSQPASFQRLHHSALGY